MKIKFRYSEWFNRMPSLPFWLFTGVAVLRLIYCFQIPWYTTDLLRNLGYGKAFYTWGFHVYDLTPLDFSPSPSQFLWSNHHYTYPPLGLSFFVGLAGIWPSLFFGKLMLTIIDGINTILVYRITRERRLALLFWLNPISVWFTSHEGQFEAWTAFWMLWSFYELQRNKPWALGLLSLSIQTKLFPVFLLPYFMARLSWRQPKRLAYECGWGMLSLIPLVWILFTTDYFQHLIKPGYIPAYNPVSWTIGDPSLHPFFPEWLVWAHWIAGLVFVLGCIYGLYQTRNLLDFCAPMFFVVVVKSNLIAQFWYLMLTPVFCLTVGDVRLRRLLFILAFCLGIRCLYSIFIGHIGYQNPPDAYYLLERTFWGF